LIALNNNIAIQKKKKKNFLKLVGAAQNSTKALTLIPQKKKEK